jgi:hypothetical protein
MLVLVSIVKWEIVVFVLGLAAIVAVQLLTREINTHNLLCGRISGTRRKDDRLYFSPERVQLLLFTLAAGLYYLSLVFTNPEAGKLPEVPETWPAILGGSNLVYLAGKVYARWFAKRPITHAGDQP